MPLRHACHPHGGHRENVERTGYAPTDFRKDKTGYTWDTSVPPAYPVFLPLKRISPDPSLATVSPKEHFLIIRDVPADKRDQFRVDCAAIEKVCYSTEIINKIDELFVP